MNTINLPLRRTLFACILALGFAGTSLQAQTNTSVDTNLPPATPTLVTTSGHNLPMSKVVKYTLPVPGSAPQTLLVTNRASVVQKPTPTAVASFQFTKGQGATGYRAYWTYNPPVWAGTGDMGDTNIFTLKDINPHRPIYVQVTSLNGTNESTGSQTAWLAASPSSWSAPDGQHFAMLAPTNKVMTVEAESVLNGPKTTVGTWTNQPVISFTRPTGAKEFYIFTAR